MVFPLCLPCVVLVLWVGDCVLVVSCVAWAGLLELRFCIWFGTCCCVITCWVSPCRNCVGSGVVFMCWCLSVLCVCLVLRRVVVGWVGLGLCFCDLNNCVGFSPASVVYVCVCGVHVRSYCFSLYVWLVLCHVLVGWVRVVLL